MKRVFAICLCLMLVLSVSVSKPIEARKAQPVRVLVNIQGEPGKFVTLTASGGCNLDITSLHTPGSALLTCDSVMATNAVTVTLDGFSGSTQPAPTPIPDQYLPVIIWQLQP